MQTPTFQPRINPLANYMRQPKIYIKLPSQGNFWPNSSIDIPENGEFPVYSMTARDELLFKTPDALLNGQAIVDVIQSCIPNIKNAWECPMIDLDTILIAIRLASYGEKMEITHVVPGIGEEVTHELDLRILLQQQQTNTWVEQIAINPEFIVYVKPLTYKHLTKTSLKNFESSRILSMLEDTNISDEKKMEIFNTSFSNLTQITIDLIVECIAKIATPEAEVADRKFIAEFIANADKELFKTIQSHLEELKKKNDLKPLEFTTTEEQQELGAPPSYSIPVNLNNSDFFE